MDIISPVAVSPIIGGPNAGKWITVKKTVSGPTTVPKGYVFDFASLPWIARRFIARVSPWYAMAVLLHDYRLDKERHIHTRKHIDNLFHEDLLTPIEGQTGFKGKYRRFRAWVMFKGVSTYGLITERGGYAKI